MRYSVQYNLEIEYMLKAVYNNLTRLFLKILIHMQLNLLKT